MSFLNALNPLSWVGKTIEVVTDKLTHKRNSQADADKHAALVAADIQRDAAAVEHELKRKFGAAHAKSPMVRLLSLAFGLPLVAVGVGMSVYLLGVVVYHLFPFRPELYAMETARLLELFPILLSAFPQDFWGVVLTLSGLSGAGVAFHQRGKRKQLAEWVAEKEAQRVDSTVSQVSQETIHPVTAAALAKLKKDEGFSGTPYICTEGYLTIGIGTKLASDKVSSAMAQAIKKAKWVPLDDDVVELMAVEKIDEIRTRLKSLDWYIRLDDRRKVIIICLCYWLGYAGFMGFAKTVEAIKAGDYATAAKELMDSKIGRGEQGEGVKRRMQRYSDEMM